MKKDPEYNSTLFELLINLERSTSLVSNFLRKHFGKAEFSTKSENKDKKSMVLIFGYKIEGHNREVGNIIYKMDIDACCIVIEDFAKKKFVDYMDESKVFYREVKV